MTSGKRRSVSGWINPGNKLILIRCSKWFFIDFIIYITFVFSLLVFSGWYKIGTLAKFELICTIQLLYDRLLNMHNSSTLRPSFKRGNDFRFHVRHGVNRIFYGMKYRETAAKINHPSHFYQIQQKLKYLTFKQCLTQLEI